MDPWRGSALAALAMAAAAWAQSSGWLPGQINASMCMWKEPRVAILRDTVYADGGLIYWSHGMEDGTAAVSPDDNYLGLIYTLQLGQTFRMSDNITAVLGTMSKAMGGQGSASNEAPNYEDGGMLANNDQFFLYGGLVAETDTLSPPGSQEILGYRANQYGPERPTFRPGFFTADLPDNVSRYVAYGAAVNAPSENLGWYFSGFASPTRGPIFQREGDDSLNAVNASNTLISIDMSVQQQEKWTNRTLPDYIRGRANPDAAWLPVGRRGIVVVIGGSTYPEWAAAFPDQNRLQSAKLESQEFTHVIDVYDVATDIWYQQSAPGGPGTRTRACAVGAASRDYSSFNIYYYGGYSGADATEGFSDEVWVLSLPSFTWTKLSSGVGSHGRAGHKCVRPLPDQMMVVGGYTALPDDESLNCLDGFVQVLNLTDGTWADRYDPAVYGDYKVPQQVISVVGGDSYGGATVTGPVSSGWQTVGLGSVFATPYPSSRTTAWYHYPKPSPSSGGGGGGGEGGGAIPSQGRNTVTALPPWAASVMGAILGLVFVTLLIVGCLVLRRCRRRRRHPERPPERRQGSGSVDRGGRIMSWMHKGSVMTSTDGLGVKSEGTSESGPKQPQPSSAPEGTSPRVSGERHEMDNTGLAELMDTSAPVELGDTGLGPTEIISKHTHFSPGAGAGAPGVASAGSTSYFSSGSGSYRSSAISDHFPLGFSFDRGQETRGSEQSSPVDPSAAAAAAAAAAARTGPGMKTRASSSSSLRCSRPRMVSGVSGLSERDAAHLRQMSEGAATVSTISCAEGTPADDSALTPDEDEDEDEDTPTPLARAPLAVSPHKREMGRPGGGPAAGDKSECEAEDYVTAKKGAEVAGPPNRRSVFKESEQDMGTGG